MNLLSWLDERVLMYLPGIHHLPDFPAQGIEEIHECSRGAAGAWRFNTPIHPKPTLSQEAAFGLGPCGLRLDQPHWHGSERNSVSFPLHWFPHFGQNGKSSLFQLASQVCYGHLPPSKLSLSSHRLLPSLERCCLPYADQQPVCLTKSSNQTQSLRKP